MSIPILNLSTHSMTRVILDTQDLLVYFQEHQAAGTLPSFDDLLALAERLDYMYSSERAYEAAAKPRDRQPSSSRAPEHEDWVDMLDRAESGEDHDFEGDRVLANSICFLMDVVHLREWCRSTADGEVGDLYEILKVCSHSDKH